MMSEAEFDAKYFQRYFGHELPSVGRIELSVLEQSGRDTWKAVLRAVGASAPTDAQLDQVLGQMVVEVGCIEAMHFSEVMRYAKRRCLYLTGALVVLLPVEQLTVLMRRHLECVVNPAGHGHWSASVLESVLQWLSLREREEDERRRRNDEEGRYRRL